MTNTQIEILVDFIDESFLDYISEHQQYNSFAYVSEITDLFRKLKGLAKKNTVQGNGGTPKEKANREEMAVPAQDDQEQDEQEQELVKVPEPEREDELEWIR